MLYVFIPFCNVLKLTKNQTHCTTQEYFKDD
jgi:hypothetical protein